MNAWQVIPDNHPALAGHFPGNPIVPGVVLLSEVVEAARREMGQDRRCSGFPSVKFLAPLRPGVAFSIELESGSGNRVRFVCKTAQCTIAQGTLHLDSGSGAEA